MANEVLFDTSGFFALMDSSDCAYEKAVDWMKARRAKTRPVTTEWIIGETCTLLVARKQPHLVSQFLDSLEGSDALVLVNPDESLLQCAKAFIRRQAEHGYSFVDCLSFCLMKERRIREAFTSDEHFQRAGFVAVLV